MGPRREPVVLRQVERHCLEEGGCEIRRRGTIIAGSRRSPYLLQSSTMMGFSCCTPDLSQ